MTDEQRVLELRAAGDADGAATLAIRTLGPLVLRYLRPMLKDEDDVADCFSLWAERVWRGLPGFEGRSALRTWAVRLACNAALNYRDQAYRRRERRLATGEASAVADDVRTRSFQVVERQRQELLRLREQLTPEEQTLLFLRIDQKLSWEEIAEAFAASGKPLTAEAATKRFERLKERLRVAAGKRPR